MRRSRRWTRPGVLGHPSPRRRRGRRRARRARSTSPPSTSSRRRSTPPREEAGSVVLDLREVTFIDSAGLRLVLETSRAGAGLRRRPRPARGAAHLRPRRPRRAAADDARSAAGRVRRRTEGAWATLVGIALVFALSYLDAAWDEQNIAATIVIGAVSDGDVRRRPPDRGGGRVRDRRGRPQRRLQRQLRLRRLLRPARRGDRGRGLRGRWPRARAARSPTTGTASGCCAARRDRRHRGRDPRGRRPRRRAARPRLRRHLRDRRPARRPRSSGSASSRTGPTPRRSRQRLRARGPWTLEAIRAGRPLLVAHVDEAHLRAQRARRGGPRVPALAAGALAHQRPAALARAQRRHAGAAGDLAPVRRGRPRARDLLAGRIGLALDNAGLFAELEALQLPADDRAGHARRGGHDPGRRAAASSTPTRPRRPRSATPRPPSCSRPRRARSSPRSSPSTRTARRCALEELPGAHACSPG